MYYTYEFLTFSLTYSVVYLYIFLNVVENYSTIKYTKSKREYIIFIFALLKIIISKCSPKGYKKNKNINLALANTINLIIFHMNIYFMEKKLGPILMVGKMINCIEYGFGKKKEKEYNIR